MKTEEKQKAVTTSAVVGWYITVTVAGLWRALRGRGRHGEKKDSVSVLPSRPSELANLPEGAYRGDRSPTEPQLQELQASQGGTDFDRLAGAAADKQNNLQHQEVFSTVVPLTRQPLEQSEQREEVACVLRHQSLDSQLLAGWGRSRPDKLPVPTYAPAIMAFGIVLFAMGLATTWYVCFIGAMVFAVAARRWIGELQEE